MFANSTKLFRRLLIVALTLLSTPTLGALSPAVESAIDAIGKQAVASGQTAGLAIAVAERREITFAHNYGQANIELNVPVGVDSVFRIGSITKQFAAASVLLLAEQKKLSLDDKLAKFFPDFPRASEVSLRQLLDHTSGIHEFTSPIPETIARVGISMPEMVKHIAGLGYDFDPGTSWSYSNSGYLLIGAVIEQVSGQSFREFAAERLFKPLGMTHTAVDVNEEIAPGRASGYGQDPTKKGAFLNAKYSHMSVPHAAGAIRSTAADLVVWTAALHGGRVLSAASLKEMITPVTLPPGKEPPNYGLGLHLGKLEGQAMIGHAGSIDGFTAILYYFVDRQMTVVILSNTEGGTQGLGASMTKALFAQPEK